MAQPEVIATQLMASHEQFIAFVRKRVDDPELAADLVQDSLLKAIRSADAIQDSDNLIPWFYRILRRTVLDLYRRRDVRQRVLAEMPEDFEAAAVEQEKNELCGCLHALLPSLRPEYAEVIEAVDLREEGLEAAAKRMGVTRNNLTVRLHRARQQLQERLLQTCRLCARHGCLDCDCRR